MQAIDSLNNFQELSSLGFPDFNKLSEQLYLQLEIKVNKFEE
jgi:hypothetical protein